jgi:hypothetical protein
MKYLFVGVRRSQRAIDLGLRWEDGGLAAAVLFDALRASIFDPEEQEFINLWEDEGTLLISSIRRIRRSSLPVVGMGRRVQRKLTELGVFHKQMVHPAARGAIRKRSNYRIHVHEVLTSPSDSYTGGAQ